MSEAMWIVIGIISIWALMKRKQQRKSNELKGPVARMH
jgi:hypothetical protein